MEKEKRIVKKSFRFTEREWLQIEKKCEVACITPSQYFQQIAITGQTAKQDCLKEKQMYIGEIAMVGNDIYTIARKLQAGNSFDFLILNILLKVEKKLNEAWLL